LTVGGPHLLSVDDELIAVAAGLGAHRGQVASGLRLTEQLTPDVLTRTHPREELVLQLSGTRGDDRGRG
jgi:hypothetical protein